MSKIKRNELDCRDTAPLIERCYNTSSYSRTSTNGHLSITATQLSTTATLFFLVPADTESIHQKRNMDQLRFLGNCPPTPPLSEK